MCGDVCTPVLRVTLGMERREGMVMYLRCVTLQEMDLERLARRSFWASQMSLKRTWRALWRLRTRRSPGLGPQGASKLCCDAALSESDSEWELEMTKRGPSSLLTMLPGEGPESTHTPLGHPRFARLLQYNDQCIVTTMSKKGT